MFKTFCNDHLCSASEFPSHDPMEIRSNCSNENNMRQLALLRMCVRVVAWRTCFFLWETATNMKCNNWFTNWTNRNWNLWFFAIWMWVHWPFWMSFKFIDQGASWKVLCYVSSIWLRLKDEVSLQINFFDFLKLKVRACGW